MRKILRLCKYIYQLTWSNEKYARKLGVKIGKNCFISTRKFSSEPYLIEIGDGCRIVSGVTFYTHGAINALRRNPINAGSKVDIFGKIKVGNYTFIGNGAMIMPGVIIGDNCIIGAGTIVTKSIPDNTIVGGNPMRVIGFSNDYWEYAKSISTETYGMTPRDKKKVLLSIDDSKFIRKGYIKTNE